MQLKFDWLIAPEKLRRGSMSVFPLLDEWKSTRKKVVWAAEPRTSSPRARQNDM